MNEPIAIVTTLLDGQNRTRELALWRVEPDGTRRSLSARLPIEPGDSGQYKHLLRDLTTWVCPYGYDDVRRYRAAFVGAGMPYPGTVIDLGSLLTGWLRGHGREAAGDLYELSRRAGVEPVKFDALTSATGRARWVQGVWMKVMGL